MTRLDDDQLLWEAASGLFKVLSSPLRIGIIALLADRPRTVGQLVDELGVSQPLISQHLKVLRDTCLVEGKRARETTYQLMDDHVTHIVRDAITHITEHDPHTPRSTHRKA